MPPPLPPSHTAPPTTPYSRPHQAPQPPPSYQPVTERRTTQPPDHTPPPSKRKRKGSRGPSLLRALCLRPLGVVARTLAIVVPLLAAAVGLLYLRLGYGPVTVSFLAGPIERALNAELPGFSFGIGNAVLQKTDSGGIEFRLKSVRMNDRDGGVVALAKFASIELDPRAFLSLRIAPSRVDLIEPRFLVFFDDRGALSLKAPTADEPIPGAPKPQPAPPVAAPTPDPGVAPRAGERRPDVGQLIAQSLERMRRDGQTASYLKDLGFKNATLIIDEGGRQTVWRIPEVDIDLQHKQKRSIIVGRAVFGSAGDVWSMRFRAENSDKAKSVRIKGEVEDLVPRGLARQIPALAALEAIDAPVTGTIDVDLDTGGGINGATASFNIDRGALQAPWQGGPAIGLTKGRLDLKFNGDTGAFELLPSPLALSIGNLTLVGNLTPRTAAGSPARDWQFELKASDGVLAPSTADSTPVKVDRLSLVGKHIAGSGQTLVERFSFKAGGAEIELASAAPDPLNPSRAGIEGRIAPVTVAGLLSVWPAELAPRTRAYLAKNVRAGAIRSGTFRIGTASPTATDERRLSLTIEAGDIELDLAKGLPPLEIPRTLVRVEGTSIEITIPDAAITAAPGKRLTAKAARYTAVGIDGPKPLAEIAGRIQGSLPTALDLLDRDPIRLLRQNGIQLPPAIDGKLDAQVRVAFPVGDDVDLTEARLDGKIRLTDGRIRHAIGNHDLTGATINIDASDKVIELKGDMLLAGVAAKLQGRWVIGAAEQKAADPKQPIARLALRLDDNDRQQLGLDLDRLVHGDIPIEVLLFRESTDKLKTRVTADLTAAEILLDELNWRKPPGRPAKLDFDVAKEQTAKTIELQNFKLDGENIAIDGWVSIGPDNKPRAFYFPEFLLNVVSNMEVQGTMRPERVWEVKVRGKSSFDAGDVFRAMLTLDRTPQKPPTKERPGVDLTAEFDTALGLNEQRLKQVRLRIWKKNDQLSGLEFRGLLEGGRPITGIMRPEPGKPRVLRIETMDSGQALKLIGIYQNMVDGKGTLDLNLDGAGAADTQGSVVIKRFRLLGDPIASEVFQAPDESRPVIDQGRPGRRVLREQFDFEQLLATFSVGNGQLVIDNAIAEGPLIGASLRGKIDFRSRRLQVGGTYVPLSGLNRAIGFVPLVREILTGPRGEGVLGITYAVQGPMANPQVIVNPFSPLTPGLLRELMQMTPENPTITPRAEPPRKALPKGAGPQTRASPPAELAPDAVAPRQPPEVIDGWSTTAREAPKRK